MRLLRRSILLSLACASFAEAQGTPSRGCIGMWEGALQVGVARLRLGLTIERDTNGALAGVMTSIDQGNAKIPAIVATSGDTVTIIMAAVNARFQGVMSAGGDSLTGAFTQGAPLPLAFHRVSSFSGTARPQEPRPPFPYRTRDVEFESVPGVRLAGTVTMPAGTGPFPAVVLVTGSGPQNRDEELMGHKPFLVLADFLARRGIASLRADDRGVGKSSGTFATATSADFANDAEAALRFLGGTGEIDAKRIGIIGHSEGGLIAPMIAARNSGVAFIVLLAGPGLPGDSLLMLQSRALARAAGAAAVDLDRAARFNRTVYDIVRGGGDDAQMRARMLDAASRFAVELRPTGTTDSVVVRALMQQSAAMFTPWYRYFIGHDPRTDLRSVRVPVLAMNGMLDLQVPYQENLAAINAALREGGNRHVEIVELAGLNHLFQTARTGAVSEYATIEETMSPVALERIATWITRVTKR